MVFGKRMQVNGFFSAEADGARDVNMAGAQLGLRQFAVIKSEIYAKNLIEKVESTGKAIASSVARSGDKSSRITGTRTVGSSTWIDTGDHATTMELFKHMREHGVLVKLNGARGVMTKPALTLSESQAGPLATALSKF